MEAIAVPVEVSPVERPRPSLAALEEAFRSHFQGELWQAVKACLAVIAAISLSHRDNCLVLIFEGPSGRGKSVVVRSLMPDPNGAAMHTHLIRADEFTPASFVSHAANRTAEQLKTIDLLPRLQDRVMLTKELAPLFRGDERDLRKSFAKLTSVLDGDGYQTNSGEHGERGYVGRYIFNWVGATTPIPNQTHRIMAQLGNRILFYEVAGEDFSEDELMKFARERVSADAVEECRAMVNGFLEGHFENCPVNSIEPESILISDDFLRELVRYAELVAQGRVELLYDNGILETGSPEGPQRVILLLLMLARGLALVEGRSEVSSEDMSVTRHVAFSSIPRNRRDLLRAVIDAAGLLEVSEVERALNVSRPTALSRMKELGATGICLFTEGNPQGSKPGMISLTEPWRWLLPTP